MHKGNILWLYLIFLLQKMQISSWAENVFITCSTSIQVLHKMQINKNIIIKFRICSSEYGNQPLDEESLNINYLRDSSFFLFIFIIYMYMHMYMHKKKKNPQIINSKKKKNH